MRKVLVAGATGYLGKHVVQAFKEQGFWVRALARNPNKLSVQGPFLEPAVDRYLDDVFVGQVTQPETLTGLCRDIEIVFSSIGITRQRDKLTFREVDYQGNVNILKEALKAGVRKFIFVSVFQGQRFTHLAGIRAREDFVTELASAGLEYTVIRPTGYYSDMSEFLRMAEYGCVFLIGRGDNRMNPIHGKDLAEVCVAAVDDEQVEVPVGGPQVFSYRQIAELAFKVLHKPVRITSLSPRFLNFSAQVIRPFSALGADLIQFMMTAMTNEGIAPQYGVNTLECYYRELSGGSSNI